MRTGVLDILQCFSHQYEMMVLNLYTTWCDVKTTNKVTFQKALTCKPLFNWWYRELKKLEDVFVYNYHDYAGALDQSAAKDLYSSAVKSIFTIFSKPLMQLAYDA